MKVILESISITNFRGIATFLHNFKSGSNVLSAPFGYGKTTIKDAFLYGMGLPIKNIKPCKFEKNRWVEIPHLEPEITLTLAIDNDKITLTRGEKGTQSIFKIDNEKYGTLKAYQDQVLSLLQLDDIETLKDLIVVGNFMERDNKEIRKILFDLTRANDVLLDFQNSYDTLKQDFENGLTTDDISLNIKRDLKQVENDKIILQTKIQTYNEFLSTHDTIDQEKLEHQIKLLNFEKSKLQSTLESTTKELIYKYNNALSSWEVEKNRMETQKNEISLRINELLYSLNNDERLLKEANDELYNAQSMTIDPITICPTCGQKLEKGNNFERLQEQRKAERIKEATLKVEKLKAEMAKKKDNVAKYKENIATVEAMSNVDKLATLVANLKIRLGNMEHDNEPVKNHIADIEKELNELNQQISNAQIVQEQKDLLKQAQSDLKDLLVRTQVIYAKSDELKDYLSKIENKLTKHINDFFVAEKSGLGWKLYENAKNGNLLTTMELMYQNKKQYSTCSRGEQLDANCMLVFFLQDCYNLDLPIFIDNITDLGGKSYQVENQIIYLQTNNKANNFEIEKY